MPPDAALPLLTPALPLRQEPVEEVRPQGPALVPQVFAARPVLAPPPLAVYRVGGIDGNASVYTLSRQDLQRWYYVDQITPTQLQHKYRTDHGVYADNVV